MTVYVDVLRNGHRFGAHKLQQGCGDARVPGGDAGLGLCQVPPAALQIGGRRAVLGHVGQLLVQHAIVGGPYLTPLLRSHQALGHQQVRIQVWNALPGPGIGQGRKKEESSF